MTAEEWEKSEDPRTMLEFLGEKAPARQFRYLACAACRAVWDKTWPQRSKKAVKVAERYADWRATGRELSDARSRASQAASDALVRAAHRRVDSPAAFVFESRLGFAADAALDDPHIGFRMTAIVPRQVLPHDEALKVVFPSLIRDIFPFRTTEFDPQWRTQTVLLLAKGIYDDRAWDRLGILADALMDAGADGPVVDHLRGPGPHVLGCHVLDAILGKE